MRQEEEQKDGRPDESGLRPYKEDTHSRGGNVGVPVGGILILVSFLFIPFVSIGGLTAIKIALNHDAAEAAFAVLGVSGPMADKAVRMLMLLPALALTVLMIELAVPPGHGSRPYANVAVAIAGALLSLVLGSVGLCFGAHFGPGFWGTLTGSLFILVGGIFNVARGE